MQPAIVLAVRDQASCSVIPSLCALDVNYSILGDEGFEIIPAGNSLFVTANGPAGVLNGTYRLLERLGFAWYDPYETHLPEQSTLQGSMSWQRIRETPRVALRGFWVFDREVPDEFAVWSARNRFNLAGRPRLSLERKLRLHGWSGGHNLLQEEFSRPGLFEVHPDWFAQIDGQRQPIPPSGPYFNPAFGNEAAANYFADRMIARLEHGDLRGVDVLNVWPNDDRGNSFDQSPEAEALGNETDNLLHFYAILCERLHAAFRLGALSRPVTVGGISYFLTMRTPTNRAVTARLESADYLHVFYPIERSWSAPIDKDLGNQEANRRILSDLAAWQQSAVLDYGVVEYYNFSNYAAVGLTDHLQLAANYEVMIRGRNSLYAYMHPLLRNAGPRRLTNGLLARLAWENEGQNDPSHRAEQFIQEFFTRRYGTVAQEWRDVHELMAHSVENAKEMFGTNSLYWVLFQDLIWASPFYSPAQVAAFIPLYRKGGAQDLPAAFSGLATERAIFRGLDDSLSLQQQAASQWLTISARVLPDEVRARIDSDIAWFAATASRYRLMAATCDYFVASQANADVTEPRARMQQEIALLEASPVTADTISPVDQRIFLGHHRTRAGIQ
jgi:Domain of unknown function (DUF4838)